ncbi:MAG: DUF4139 domain-containing protein [Bacteroidia bacterium]|nr:DUF4139 domain-containing protein [Bacteroidia bacterium]
MKTILTLVFILQFNAFFLYAGDKPKSIKSEIKEVSVFLRGAQVTRAGSINIGAGTSQVIFEDLPSNINSQSIQVSGKGEFTILSVQHQLNYLKRQQITKEIKEIKDSLLFLNDQFTTNKDQQTVYQDEEAMIKSNKSIGGQNVGVKIQDLKDGAEYFRARLTDIKTKWYALQKQNVKLNEVITRLNSQLSVLNSKENKPTSEVIITVNAKAPGNANLSLSYLVNDAGWTPLYDLRAKDINNPVELTYKGNVWQLSGEDWDKISLTLNTGNPTISGTKPELAPWYLYLQETYKVKEKRKYAPTMTMAKEESKKADKIYETTLAEDGAMSATTGADYTEMNENQTNVEFKIEVPYSVPSDGKQYIVEVQKYTVPASYEYFSAPKLDKDAFLIAHVTGWEAYNLVSGDMNLFFEGTYVGKSYLDAVSTKDTLDISLGRDKNITVTRTKMKDFSKKNFIGANKKGNRSQYVSALNLLHNFKLTNES